ncbi:hypothetical protein CHINAEXTREME_00110 [Halobiforma lacisalsi AJ5]|uniref:DUF7124 domain-containing protein n=1 Tax=Natronobacterium lacisalsi AJ5 TaxID=358396 RepID=M0LTB9_NATLA|nr:hypothetical protein [Halobiforma lacisalsi]APW96259.1 hypothetical protein CHINAEXTREME_00110 [Halobiforma lacisalsi AJ5]EMA36398.1 hypothetical protein C445_03168 [Halobiforma lacisalsi AJ5]
MTDRIDLDDLETDADEEETDANPGDWIWRGEGTPEEEPEPTRAAGATTEPETADSGDDGDATESDSQPAPRVPRDDASKPAGIPTEHGGAGAGAVAGTGTGTETDVGTGNETNGEPRPAGSAAEGPHGGGVDDMTMAFTYDALERFADPAAVFAAASGWADWIGIVGDVETHRITKFQRTHGVDADFFTGSGTDPAERLRGIDRTSMFYAERMVVVGLEDADDDRPDSSGEAIADAADWEFVPLETAAEKADWELE